MLIAGIRSLTCAPPRRLTVNRRLPARLTATRTNVGVTNGEDVMTSYTWGYAVRREWPGGAHDLFGFTSDREDAERQLARDEGFWRAGPVRPVTVYVVAASASDVDQHPLDGCLGSTCPNAPQRGQSR
ncbi:hypothetical protein ACQPYA_10070 [Micromonospora sp. CA-263727]|uniref:hypothetical protein n=1 Tax=Micromonospora sp. CA-263727 TaxID=3239967 RepID=UPI003D8C0047